MGSMSGHAHAQLPTAQASSSRACMTTTGSRTEQHSPCLVPAGACPAPAHPLLLEAAAGCVPRRGIARSTCCRCREQQRTAAEAARGRSCPGVSLPGGLWTTGFRVHLPVMLLQWAPFPSSLLKVDAAVPQQNGGESRRGLQRHVAQYFSAHRRDKADCEVKGAAAPLSVAVVKAETQNVCEGRRQGFRTVCRVFDQASDACRPSLVCVCS